MYGIINMLSRIFSNFILLMEINIHMTNIEGKARGWADRSQNCLVDQEVRYPRVALTVI